MAEYIFYTAEGFTQDPQGNDVENCQLLGRAHGANMAEALQNLIKKSPWIEEHGFNPYEAIGKELA